MCPRGANVEVRVGEGQKRDATRPCLTDLMSRRVPSRRDRRSIRWALARARERGRDESQVGASRSGGGRAPALPRMDSRLVRRSQHANERGRSSIVRFTSRRRETRRGRGVPHVPSRRERRGTRRRGAEERRDTAVPHGSDVAARTFMSRSSFHPLALTCTGAAAGDEPPPYREWTHAIASLSGDATCGSIRGRLAFSATPPERAEQRRRRRAIGRRASRTFARGSRRRRARARSPRRNARPRAHARGLTTSTSVRRARG